LEEDGLSRVAIYTLGCKVNQADSDKIARELSVAGFEVVKGSELAEIYIINTCTVTSKAAYQSRQAVRRFIKKNPNAKIYVLGCDVEFEKDVLEKIEGVTAVFGNEERGEFLSFLRRQESRLKTMDPRVTCPPSFNTYNKWRKPEDDVKKPWNDNAVRSTQYAVRARPFIKIQDGCENFCTYCIVPYMRGKIKSETPENVIKEIQSFHTQGFYEVVLTGIHIGKYGQDLRNENLVGLLRLILDKTDISRIRLSSIDPDEIGLDLIELIKNSNGRICPHLHIPLQSGCNETLKRMERKYLTEDYERCLCKIKEEMPDIAIGADVITGFPNETDEEFDETRAFIEKMPITYLHVFSYSDREGTKAFDMKDKVAENVKKERTRVLRSISEQKRKEYLRSSLEKHVNVVFDRHKVIVDDEEYWKGVSDNYINVLVEKRDFIDNHYRVKLIDILDENMVGRVITRA